ncbi:unnamed protein product [Linum trigynum]|uniref:Uncharacterized protein n=1 Tax=Linum trigynum TaxID=586398 RepID=A0AAV2EAI4_9ROSI
MFSKILVTGEGAWTSLDDGTNGTDANTNSPSQVEAINLMDDDEFLNFTIGTNRQGNNPAYSGDKRTKPMDETPHEQVMKIVKKKKVGTAGHFQKQLDRLVDVVEIYAGSRTQAKKDERVTYTISECMGFVKGLPGVDNAPELITCAGRLFKDMDKREIFISLGTQELQLHWLKRRI